jgi:integrase
VLRRQLKLRKRLQRAGLINHDQLFFHDNGEPIRSLLGPAERWRQTLTRLGIRYRKPYAARHTSVSWNLMIGKVPLYNAKQHGHSLTTMWRVYPSWMNGAPETDIEAVQRAMDRRRRHRFTFSWDSCLQRIQSAVLWAFGRIRQRIWHRDLALTPSSKLSV